MKDQNKNNQSLSDQSLINMQKLALTPGQLKQVKGGNGGSNAGQNQTNNQDYIGIVDLVDG